jgi:hypothetical protein
VHDEELSDECLLCADSWDRLPSRTHPCRLQMHREVGSVQHSLLLLLLLLLQVSTCSTRLASSTTQCPSQVGLTLPSCTGCQRDSKHLTVSAVAL